MSCEDADLKKEKKKSFDTAAGVFTIHTTHYKFLFLLLL